MFFLLFQGLFSWSFVDEFSLKKDEFIMYKIGTKDLLFRWTLFHNKGLVYTAKFDKFSYQGILYENYKLDSAKFNIATNKIADKEPPYCLISFKSCADKLCSFALRCQDVLNNVLITKITQKED